MVFDTFESALKSGAIISQHYAMSEVTMAVNRGTGFDVQSISIGTPAVRLAIQSLPRRRPKGRTSEFPGSWEYAPGYIPIDGVDAQAGASHEGTGSVCGEVVHMNRGAGRVISTLAVDRQHVEALS